MFGSKVLNYFWEWEFFCYSCCVKFLAQNFILVAQKMVILLEQRNYGGHILIDEGIQYSVARFVIIKFSSDLVSHTEKDFGVLAMTYLECPWDDIPWVSWGWHTLSVLGTTYPECPGDDIPWVSWGRHTLSVLGTTFNK